MSSNFLKITFSKDENQKETIDKYGYRNKPFSNSEVYCATVKSFQQLAHGVDVKTVYQLDLSLKGVEHDFLPGDAIGILPENDPTEVNELLIRLGTEQVCGETYFLEIAEDTTKKNAVIPKHLPPSSTLRDIFLKHIDIRTPPKKVFLKSLIKYTKDLEEKEKLETICSPSGSEEYANLLTKHRTLLALLNAFPSCLPPTEIILEYSSPLNPRFFSIASSPLKKNILSIIFFVLEFESGLKGVCTGWLQKLLQESELKDKKVPFYFRKPTDFRFSNLEKPSILIATGTGIAPFRGFLQHKQISGNLTETWLFYGCRYVERDFLCQEELTNYLLQDGVLAKFYTAFSRDIDKKIYIQHTMEEHKHAIVDLVTRKEATIFICGDAKTVVKSVRESFIQFFMDCNNVDRPIAEDIVNNLVASKRYLVDSWI